MKREETLLLCWERLVGIDRFTLSVESSHPEKPYKRIGGGEIEVQQIDPSTLLFYEKGTWKSDQDTEYHFSTILRWTLSPEADRISLEHLRYGIERPILLVELASTSSLYLEPLQPFLCGEDCYRGSLTATGEADLLLHWQIRGPHKQEEIDIHYTPSVQWGV